jgi:hypothetical protein
VESLPALTAFSIDEVAVMGYSPPTPKPEQFVRFQLIMAPKQGAKLTIKEERPSVADDPAVEVQTPARSQHQQADEHDQSILDQTPASSNPVTNNADSDLAGHDAHDFKIGDGSNPVIGAFLPARSPALRPRRGEQRLEIADTEENVPLEPQAGAGEDGIAEIPRERAERVPLEHLPGRAQLLLVLGGLHAADEFYALPEGEIGPVDALGREAVFGMGHVAEDTAFLLRGAFAVLASRVVFVLITCCRAVRHRDFPQRGRMV